MQRKNGGRPPVPTPKQDSFEAFHDLQQMASSDPMNGAVIHSRYEILGKIGQGGMARIYLANDRKTSSRVAVKILSDNPERNEELTERLLIEAKAAATINHPNVIKIIDIGTYKDKTFCVMEYLEGRDLASQLAMKEAMKWERAKRILAQICDALEAAHEKGVIHRDMKPENVMLIGPTGAEHVKVLDFGLAKLTGNSERLTRENIVLGTPTYMAPEQAWSRDYDKRVDIYALGVIAYELVCGTVPFSSDIPDEKARTFQVLLMHKQTEPEKPSERHPALNIPKEAEAAIMRALEKDPAKRFQSAREMRQALLNEKSCEPTIDFEGDIRAFTIDEKRGEGLVAERCSNMAPWSLPPEERRFGNSLKKYARRAIITGMIATAGFAAYRYRDTIIAYFENLWEAKSSEKHTDPSTEQPSTTTALNSSYQARIESTPRNAMVYDITGGAERRIAIGRTPLEATFRNYENVLLISKPGYYPVRITVTRSQPDQKVSLRLVPRQMEASGDETGNPAGSVPRADPYGNDAASIDAINPPQDGQ
ncbi:MAG: serine/threonine-protein kinase [Candidatus Micrarchaeota archaeon]